MKPRASLTLLLMLCAWLASGCELQKIVEAQRAIEATESSSGSPTPTPSCDDFDQYDSLNDCQQTTRANCQSEWRTFSNGGIALCYYPVPGWEACSTQNADWIYTPYTATVCQVGATVTHWKARSVFGCSSAICACLNPQALITTCTLGLDCPTPTPSPMPTCP